MEVRAEIIKQSWIHDGPMGQPSDGHFNCECGRRIQAGQFDGKSPALYPCECGLTYTATGWIISRTHMRGEIS